LSIPTFLLGIFYYYYYRPSIVFNGVTTNFLQKFFGKYDADKLNHIKPPSRRRYSKCYKRRQFLLNPDTPHVTAPTDCKYIVSKNNIALPETRNRKKKSPPIPAGIFACKM